MNPKCFLGDGVFAAWGDAGNLILTTENGISVQNRIVLEPEVLLALAAYLKGRTALLVDAEPEP